MTYVLATIIVLFGVAAFLAILGIIALALDDNGPRWAFHVVLTVPLVILIVALLVTAGHVVQKWLEAVL